MTDKAIRRLHSDIHKLHEAQKKHKEDVHELHSDTHDLKVDQKHLKKARDGYQKDRKNIAQDRKVLSNLRSEREEKLAALEGTRQSVQAEYDASVDPSTGQGDPTLLAQLQALQQQEADLQASFGDKIEASTAKIDDLKKQIDAGKRTITHEHKVIEHDHKELKHDKKAIDHDHKHIKNARHQALKDLRPAEYKMGLKGTNKARQELGLKKVDHVIRPEVANTVGGQVGKWIAEAQTILKQHGIPLSKMNARDIATIIKFESGGNPKAINNWDSNAAAGHPSKGLMQTIDSTFNAYKLPGHNNIYNPVDNIIAGVRYAISRYGSIGNVPGIRAVHAGGSYVGY